MRQMIYSRDDDPELVDFIYNLWKKDDGSHTVLVAPSYRHAINVFLAVAQKHNIPHPIAVRETDHCELRGNSKIYFMPIGIDGSNIRGLRAHNVIFLNYENMHKESADLVVRGFLITSRDPIATVKQRAIDKRNASNE